MKTLYFVTAGAADATRASVPLHIAVNGSVEAGHDTAIVLAGDGTELLSEETKNLHRAIVSLMERAGLDAIPIVAITSFFIGAVVGLHLQHAQIDAHLDHLPLVLGVDQAGLHTARLVFPPVQGGVDVSLDGGRILDSLP